MKYYITCGVVELDEPVSNFRLIAPSRITRRYEGCSSHETCAIRVDITKDQISKHKSDNYAITSEQTLVKDSNPEVFVFINGKWAKNKELTHDYTMGIVHREDFSDWLRSHKFHYACEELGYTDQPFDHFNYHESKMAEAIRYLQKNHPECDADMLYSTSNYLASKMHCINDKYFESFWVKNAIEDAKREIKFGGKNESYCKKEIAQLLKNYPEKKCIVK